MKRLVFLKVFLLITCCGFAQLPNAYSKVSSMLWIVQDIDSVSAGWARLGFPQSQKLEEEALLQVGRGENISKIPSKVAVVNLGGFVVAWIQPLSGDNLLSKFLEERGDGVFGLNHRVSSADELESEVGRLKELGVSELLRLSLGAAGSRRTYVYMDTAEGGKYSLGLFYGPEDAPIPGYAPLGMRPSQFAFVVHEIAPVTAYWESLGFPKMDVTHGPLTDLDYRGEVGQFDQRLGWQRQGSVVYEWIEPMKGPTVYEEHLEAHGEGFHHIAFNVEDMDEAIRFFEERGIVCSQSGGWGEKGKAGSGRFAYVDTDSIGGISVELLWSYRAE